MEIFIRKKTLACPWKHCHILTLSHESNLKENIGKILLEYYNEFTHKLGDHSHG